MAKLKPDYIEWVLTLNASDAQKEIHNLSEKNKELRDSNKEIKMLYCVSHIRIVKKQAAWYHKGRRKRRG